MIKNNSIQAAAAGAVAGGMVTGGLLGAGMALMSPAAPETTVLVASAVYGGAVIGGILGALAAIVPSQTQPDDAGAINPEVAYERAA